MEQLFVTPTGELKDRWVKAFPKALVVRAGGQLVVEAASADSAEAALASAAGPGRRRRLWLAGGGDGRRAQRG